MGESKKGLEELKKKLKGEEQMETSDLEIEFEDDQREELMGSSFLTSTPFAHRFAFSGERKQIATYTGKNKEWTQLLFKKVIEPGETLRKFEFKILRCWKNKMKVGLVNVERQKNYQSSCHSKASNALTL